MADDSPFPPDKRGKNPRSLANLRPQVPGGKGLNPTGNNGRNRADRVVKILEAPAATDIERAMVKKLGLPEDTPMIDAIVHREIVAGLGKSDLARRGLREQYAGKPHQAVDLTSSDRSMSPNRKPTTAEARQELDRILETIDDVAKAAATPDDSSGGESAPAGEAEPKAEP
jgi:hypothetical protein